MVTTIYLVRHGATEGGEEQRYKGSLDVPLSEAGIEQMQKTSAYISDELRSRSRQDLSAIYCSPLSRALRSAEIIADRVALKPGIIGDLRERNFGIWEGLTFNEIRDNYPLEFDAWANNPLMFSPMGGESTIEVRDRVVPALNNILSHHNEDNIIIVAHGGVNRILLCDIMGIPLDNIFRIEQDNAALNIIEFWDKYPVVKLLNGGPVA